MGLWSSQTYIVRETGSGLSGTLKSLRRALIVNYRSRPNAAAELLEYLSFNAKVKQRQSGALVPSVLNRQLAIKRVRADS